MKNRVLKVVLVGGLVTLALLMFMGNQVTIPLNQGLLTSKATQTTFATGQTDTITVNREAGLSALAFSIHTKDSSNISLVTVRRVFNGVYAAVMAGDTLVKTDSSAAARVLIKTVTLAPLAEQYVFIVAYNADDGGLNQGVTTPNVVYGVSRQYSRVNNQ